MIPLGKTFPPQRQKTTHVILISTCLKYNGGQSLKEKRSKSGHYSRRVTHNLGVNVGKIPIHSYLGSKLFNKDCDTKVGEVSLLKPP